MKNFSLIGQLSSVYFIGIGGISMSAMAKYLANIGVLVSGSDKELNSQVISLKKSGVKVYKKFGKTAIDKSDMVVYTSAISEDNLELKYAKKTGKNIYKRSEFLAEILKDFSNSIAVSGSHGKTTATSMLSHVLIKANLRPTCFIGGLDKKLSNFYMGEKGFAVIEACEYKKNFLDLKPTVSVILNMDNDHLDSYANMDDMVIAFNVFSKNTVSFVNADDVYCKNLSLNTSITFGIRESASYTAKYILGKDGFYSFTAYAYGVKKGRINLKVFGKHNVYNALSVIAVADYLRVPFKVIKSGIESFLGVSRRMEHMGIRNKIPYFCDYAHHPTEIKAVLSELKDDKTLIVFQPHTYSRTRILMNDFISALKNGQRVIIYKTYPAREKFDEKGSAYTLYKNLLGAKVNVSYADKKDELIQKIDALKNVDKVLVLGAGDIYEITKEILKV